MIQLATTVAIGSGVKLIRLSLYLHVSVACARLLAWPPDTSITHWYSTAWYMLDSRLLSSGAPTAQLPMSSNSPEKLIASFAGARKVGRSTWYTLFAHARLPRFSGELGNFCKIYFVTLTSVCQSISPVWKMPAIDHVPLKRWRGNDENTQLFTCKNYSPICPFQVNTVTREWCNLSLFKVHRLSWTRRYKPLLSKR